MITEGKDDAGGMDPEADQALWDLLGKQEPPVKVSPYFARRVLREIALDERPRGGWLGRWRELWSLTPRYTAVCSGVLAVGMLCLSAVWTTPANRSPVAAVRPAGVNAVEASAPARELTAALADNVPVQDEEVIADLDNLLSREESRLWTEDTDTARF